MQLEALRTLLIHNPSAAQKVVDEVLSMARRGLEESRRAIQELRVDPLTTMGLVGAVRTELQAFEVRTGVSATLSVAGQESDLTDEEDRALFRIVDEALTNVERHASAQSVSVRFAFGDDRIDVTIQDDGIGFDPSTVEQDRYGLVGMQERAEMIGATLGIRSHRGRGTEIRCTLVR